MRIHVSSMDNYNIVILIKGLSLIILLLSWYDYFYTIDAVRIGKADYSYHEIELNYSLPTQVILYNSS